MLVRIAAVLVFLVAVPAFGHGGDDLLSIYQERLAVMKAEHADAVQSVKALEAGISQLQGAVGAVVEMKKMEQAAVEEAKKREAAMTTEEEE